MAISLRTLPKSSSKHHRFSQCNMPANRMNPVNQMFRTDRLLLAFRSRNWPVAQWFGLGFLWKSTQHLMNNFKKLKEQNQKLYWVVEGFNALNAFKATYEAAQLALLS